LTKEKLLSDIQDLILCCKYDKLKDERIKRLWLEKQDCLEAEVRKLSKEDHEWVDSEYIKWCIAEGIIPTLK